LAVEDGLLANNYWRVGKLCRARIRG